MDFFTCIECVWSIVPPGINRCSICGDETDIIETGAQFRIIPKACGFDGMKNWLSTINKSPIELTYQKRNREIVNFVQQYISDTFHIQLITDQWIAFLQDIDKLKKDIRGNNRKACLVFLILGQSELPDELKIKIRYMVSASKLFCAKFKCFPDIDMWSKYAPAYRSIDIETLDWSGFFPDKIWKDALVNFANLRNLGLRYYKTGGVWQRKGDRVLLAIAIMLVYQDNLWVYGMPITGKHLKASSFIVGQLLINPSHKHRNNPSQRVFRGPLKDLFPVIKIVTDTDKSAHGLRVYQMVQKSRSQCPGI